jgi:hypothetical protein
VRRSAAPRTARVARAERERHRWGGRSVRATGARDGEAPRPR